MVDKHRLNADGTKYVRQSTAEDQDIIAGLTRLIDGVEDVDFSRWRNLDKADVRMVTATGLLGGDRFDISGGKVTCRIPLRDGEERYTVALGLEIAATKEAPVRISIESDQGMVYSTMIARSGAYLLLADGAALPGSGARYGVDVGRATGNRQRGRGNVRLVRVYSVAFAVTPDFPWMTVVDRGEVAVVWRLGSAPGIGWYDRRGRRLLDTYRLATLSPICLRLGLFRLSPTGC